MAKKKKEKQSAHIRELEEMGITDIDSFYIYIEPYLDWENGVQRRELGFEYENDWLKEFENSDSTDLGIQDTVYLADCGNGICIVWKEYGGNEAGIAGLDDVQVFHSLEEAEKAFYAMKARPPLKQLIREVKEAVADPGLRIEPRMDLLPVSFRIYAGRNLAAEGMPLNAEDIRRAVSEYREFERLCQEAGYGYVEIWKPHREWNSNQRYYDFCLTGENDEVSAHVHIPSALQHRARTVIGVLRNSKEPSAVILREKVGLR